MDKKRGKTPREIIIPGLDLDPEEAGEDGELDDAHLEFAEALSVQGIQLLALQMLCSALVAEITYRTPDPGATMDRLRATCMSAIEGITLAAEDADTSGALKQELRETIESVLSGMNPGPAN